MPKRRYERDMLNIVQKDMDNSASRHRRVRPDDVEGKNLVNILSELVMLWPPRDLRLERDYKKTHDVIDWSDEHLKDMADAMQQHVIRRNYKDSELTVGVDFHSNLAEVERYNLSVQHHNQQWMEMGAPMDVFDPKHGNISKVHDAYVDPVLAQSDYQPIPDSIREDMSDGPLAKARPELERTVAVTVKYHIALNQGLFKLDYVAEDNKHRVVYYNSLIDCDLARMVRQSVQELWGNPEAYGNEAAFLEGIPMLIQGKKLDICKRENTRPGMSLNQLKTVNPELTVAEASETGWKVIHVLTGYLVPFGLLGSIFWVLYKCMEIAFWESGPQRSPVPEFLWGMGTIAALTWLTFKVAAYAHYKAHGTHMKKQYL